jgi:prepilin-type N-terminal cleavage/methylation domain-containing protein
MQLVSSRTRSARGFSLIELMIVAGLIAIVGGIAVARIDNFIKSSRADSALDQMMNTLRVARDRAIGERRNFEVRFLTPSHIQIAREELPGPATTVVTDVYLENHYAFQLISGVPDTPDAFGNATAVGFGTSPTRMFTSEGTFVTNTGDPLNGTIFMAINNDKQSPRAVTIFGATALLHGWKFNGRAWAE